METLLYIGGILGTILMIALIIFSWWAGFKAPTA
jgi:hypothetical protein